jgi:hypothetical protein
MFSSSRATRARKAADRGVSATGASWIMMGIEMAWSVLGPKSKSLPVMADRDQQKG